MVWALRVFERRRFTKRVLLRVLFWFFDLGSDTCFDCDDVVVVCGSFGSLLIASARSVVKGLFSI